MSSEKHPMQPIVWAGDVIRFKTNNIVRYLIDHGSIGLNQIAAMASDPTNGFTKEDQEQLAQLIGYSVSGYGELRYASEESVAAADAIAETLVASASGEMTGLQRTNRR